jgi:invasion protein IalB
MVMAALWRLAFPLMGCALAFAPANAQQRPAAPAATAPAPTPVPAPDRTSAQYGDWVVTCMVPPGAAQRACEMAHTILDSNQQPVGIIGFGRPNREQPMKLVVQVAANVRVAQPAKLSLEVDIALPFTLCNRQVCIVELELRDEVIQRRFRMRPAEQPGQLSWRDAAGTEVTFPVSVRGFNAAWDALSREAG